MRRHLLPHRSGFTLVELLMVIAIIGILVGLAVPAVLYGLKKVKAGAIAMEAQSISQSIEAYKNKYGDYPPDGSNVTTFMNHYRKIFPNILASEFAAVTAACNAQATPAALHVMDPPEALVFALGGFSADPTKPFTGTGGPLFNSGTVAMPVWQYNTDRNEPLFEFKQAQLTLDDSSGLALSTDELLAGGTADAMPCYVPSGKKAPFVYFDHRTYTFGASGSIYYNYYACGTASDDHGIARPYRSDTVNTRLGGVTAANADAYYEFVNEKTFQLVSGGLDDNYGNVPVASGASGPRYYRFPSGRSVDFKTAVPTVDEFSQFFDVLNDPNKFQHDNVANFSEGVLADSLNN